MAQAQILGGTYHTSGILWDAGSTVFVGALRGVGGRSLAGKVASVQIVSEAQKKSFLKATATGLAGAALAGPVGAVAGVVAGGNRKEVLFSCRTHAGSEFIAKGDSRIFELLLAESMKPQREAPSSVVAPPRLQTPEEKAQTARAQLVFLLVLLLVSALVFYYQAPITEFISPSR